MAEMIECRCHKRFYAAKVTNIELLSGDTLIRFKVESLGNLDVTTIIPSGKFPEAGGYYVWSDNPDDGRFIPAAEFNRDFHVVRDDRMNFGSALGALKRGRTVRRSAWGGSLSIWLPLGKEKCILMKAANGTGDVSLFMPTHADLFANDWEFVEAECPPK